MSLANKLVSLRKQKGLTQMDLAERLNVSRQAISRWEVGAAVPSTDNLKILSDLYGVSVDDILKGESVFIPQNTDTADAPPDPLKDTQQNRKGKGVIVCILILLTLAVIIMAGAKQLREREENTYLPVEDMTQEEDDGVGVPFSFE